MMVYSRFYELLVLCLVRAGGLGVLGRLVGGLGFS